MDTSPSYHCEIKDTAGVIDDMDKVQNAIVDFYDETGIPVEIMTVNNEDWQEFIQILKIMPMICM